MTKDLDEIREMAEDLRYKARLQQKRLQVKANKE